MADDLNQRRMGRQLWGVSPAVAEQRLTDQANRFLEEIQHLKEAIDLLIREERELILECQSLEERANEAEAKWVRLRKGLERTRSMSTLQALVLAREMADLDREHTRLMAELEEERATLLVAIDRQRESLHVWVGSLLQSVAERDRLQRDE